MSFQATHRHRRDTEKVNVSVLSAEEQTRRVHDAIARRAFQISRTHQDIGSQQVQDWLKAESELLHPLCAGRMPIDGSLWLGTDANVFEEGSIEIWVAPRQLTVCGKPRAGKEAVSPGPIGSSRAEMVYGVFDLPVDVDPGRVTAKVEGNSIEISLKKAGQEKVLVQELKVAA
jgi:hypothetical protein